jgi:two-component system OmpR family sensor kinase
LGIAVNISVRISLFVLVIVLAIMTAGAAVFLTLHATRNYLRNVEEAHQQLSAIQELAVSANRYSEQIAEFLLFGEAERPDFEEGRAQVRAALATLQYRARRQLETSDQSAVRAREQRELDRLRQMRLLFNEIEFAAERVFALDREKRRDEAIALFRDQIENRLDAEFDQMIAVATDGERAEVAESEERTEQLFRKVAVGATLTFVTILAVTLFAGFVLARSLVRPIRILTEGAAAIGRGDLDHRISCHSSGELALLSQQFNGMARELGFQRKQLLNAGVELERQVAQRTEELERANERLKVLDRLRVQFLGDVSHELRTPLTVLRGEAEVSLRGGDKSASVYRDTLTRIAEQAAEMGQHVDDLLFLARSEADQITFNSLPVSLGDVVVDALRDSAVMAARKNVAITQRLCDERILVDVDPRRLKQAIIIVLDNGVKYSEPGQALEVCMSPADGAGEITVCDSAGGIPAEDLPYVFDRFYRGSDTKTRATGGSGLGLPIAKWIVERHGGTIAIESEPGTATRVKISLPSRRQA